MENEKAPSAVQQEVARLAARMVDLFMPCSGDGMILGYAEACRVIGELEARQGTPPPRKGGRPLRKSAPGRVSEGQQRKIWALMYQLAEASPSTAQLGDRLCAIIKKTLGVEAFPAAPFAWVDYKGANKVIEALKGYVANARKRRG